MVCYCTYCLKNSGIFKALCGDPTKSHFGMPWAFLKGMLHPKITILS